jgi:hypothetical protein
MFLEKPLDLIREDGINAACLPSCNNMFDHTFVNHTGRYFNWIGRVDLILTCFYLNTIFGEEKLSWLPSINKVADKRSSKAKHCNLMRKILCLCKCKFSSADLFLKGSQLDFSSPKKFVR